MKERERKKEKERKKERKNERKRKKYWKRTRKMQAEIVELRQRTHQKCRMRNEKNRRMQLECIITRFVLIVLSREAKANKSS